jgi:hypothetical protein
MRRRPALDRRHQDAPGGAVVYVVADFAQAHGRGSLVRVADVGRADERQGRLALVGGQQREIVRERLGQFVYARRPIPMSW